MPPNESLDASGGSLFLNLIPPAMLARIRAARSHPTIIYASFAFTS
jgi:hypothetical protein